MQAYHVVTSSIILVSYFLYENFATLKRKGINIVLYFENKTAIQ